uniref:Transposase n=1 Tax=Heterorhabditis bacteriophora TaxID=37862 RepID=A0A1I7X8J5_HETBA
MQESHTFRGRTTTRIAKQELPSRMISHVDERIAVVASGPHIIAVTRFCVVDPVLGDILDVGTGATMARRPVRSVATPTLRSQETDFI